MCVCVTDDATTEKRKIQMSYLLLCVSKLRSLVTLVVTDAMASLPMEHYHTEERVPSGFHIYFFLDCHSCYSSTIHQNWSCYQVLPLCSPLKICIMRAVRVCRAFTVLLTYMAHICLGIILFTDFRYSMNESMIFRGVIRVSKVKLRGS